MDLDAQDRLWPTPMHSTLEAYRLCMYHCVAVAVLSGSKRVVTRPLFLQQSCVMSSCSLSCQGFLAFDNLQRPCAGSDKTKAFVLLSACAI